MTKETWAKATARKIGIAELDFTPTRVGQTLHIPCGKGKHVVDIVIPPGWNPNGVAKKMLKDGWIMGNKLTCPGCTRISSAKSRGAKALAESMTPQQRTDRARKAAQARWSKEEPEQVEATPMDEMTPAAKKAHRMVMMMLEEQYDETHKRYRSGWNDERIAKECGTSKASVAKTREEFFGPAGIPEEAAKLRDGIEHLRKEAAASHADFDKRLAALSSRFETAMMRNGW